jgi:putative ABC transport system substrate-binding protein
MHRRKFNCGLALAAGMAPLAGHAQTAGRTARVGSLSNAPPLTAAQYQQRPRSLEMRRLDWIEGQNLVVVRRDTDCKADRIPEFAQELVDAKVDVIVTTSSPDAEYARRLTSTLPIVTVYSGLDPVADGLIASFVAADMSKLA